MENINDYRTILKNELEDRKSKNESYSLRAFAKFLELSPSCLSEIFSGKRHLPMNKVNAVTEKLSLTPENAEAFQTSLRNLRGDFIPQKVIIVPEIKFEISSHDISELQTMMQQFLAQVSSRFSASHETEQKMALRLDMSVLYDR